MCSGTSVSPSEKKWRDVPHGSHGGTAAGACAETSYGEDAASRGRLSLLFEWTTSPCRSKSVGRQGRGVGHAPCSP